MTISDPVKTPVWTLKILPEALHEWRELDNSVKIFFKKQLEKRLKNPHILGSILKDDLQGCYKIKLRKQGYRLIYKVEENTITVLVVAVGKREDLAAYREATKRL
ncbi:MAG: type II toxin-antitoxin system RelE family toxin [Elstera sp.]